MTVHLVRARDVDDPGGRAAATSTTAASPTGSAAVEHASRRARRARTAPSCSSTAAGRARRCSPRRGRLRVVVLAHMPRWRRRGRAPLLRAAPAWSHQQMDPRPARRARPRPGACTSPCPGVDPRPARPGSADGVGAAVRRRDHAGQGLRRPRRRARGRPDLDVVAAAVSGATSIAPALAGRPAATPVRLTGP